MLKANFVKASLNFRFKNFLPKQNSKMPSKKYLMEKKNSPQEIQPLKRNVKLIGATGMSARNFLQKLFDKLKPYGIELTLHSIENNFFGHTITVSGLVTATDIAKQLSGSKADALLIPDDMLRERDSVFLDGRDTDWLATEMGMPLWPMCAADGEEFVYSLFDRLNEEK